MRYVPAGLAVLCLLVVLQSSRASAEPLDLDTIKTDETPEQLCDRLVGDPFVGFGPLEWARPFASIDAYRAVPACVKAMRANPGERGYTFKAGLAFLAAQKNEAGKKLLDRLTGGTIPRPCSPLPISHRKARRWSLCAAHPSRGARPQ